VETVNVEITWKTMTLQRSGCSYKIDDLVRRKLVTKANGNLKEDERSCKNGRDWMLDILYYKSKF